MMPWSGLSPTPVELAYEMGTSDSVLAQHPVGSPSADHGPKHEPGVISDEGGYRGMALMAVIHPNDRHGLAAERLRLPETG